jgi:hypothetical protein
VRVISCTRSPRGLYTGQIGASKIKKQNKHINEPVVIDEEILRKAKLALQSEHPVALTKCVICGSEAAPTSTENLCWVCRRLKISAWRDSDPQMTAQE